MEYSVCKKTRMYNINITGRSDKQKFNFQRNAKCKQNIIFFFFIYYVINFPL